jgi:hypothetical protein
MTRRKRQEKATAACAVCQLEISAGLTKFHDVLAVAVRDEAAGRFRTAHGLVEHL